MKHFITTLTILLFALSLSACDGKDSLEIPETGTQQGGGESAENSSTTESMTIKITAGGKTFSASIEDTETGRAFLQKLPLTLDMSELNGNEKYCYGVSLPRNDKRYNSIAAGDLMLYSGNCIVLFYGSAGGYSYTPIGKLSTISGLAAALGTGSVKVTFEKQ